MQARLNSEASIDNKNQGIESRLYGKCICPICGFKMFHEEGIPCYNRSCPKCGMIMTKTS